MVGLALSPVQKATTPARVFSQQSVLWIDTINQLLESISTRRIDHLILDPVWMEEPVWWPAILQALALTKTPWSMLLPLLNDVQIWDVAAEPHPMGVEPWPLCVVLEESGEVWHHDQTMHLSPQLKELLEVMASEPNGLISLASVNRLRQTRGEEPMSGVSLRVHLHALRHLIGPEHVVTVRRLGYRWVNCQPRGSAVGPSSLGGTVSESGFQEF